MNLWRRLFHKFNCRKCYDTGVMYRGYTMSVCECRKPRVLAEMKKTIAEIKALLEADK